MKKLISISVLCLLTLTTGAAFGEETEGLKKLAGKQVSLKFDLKELRSLPRPKVIELWLCSGSVVFPLPALGECPSKAGYVTSGIATCYQDYRVPRKSTATRTESGLFKITCELDWENAEPLGEIACDYSQCFYISEPEFPWPGTVIW